jgi:hypothetical protein
VFDHVEIAVDDLWRANAFFDQALGRAVNEYGDEYAGIRERTDELRQGGV